VLLLVVLTNAYPVGVAEGIAFTFTNLALYGKATQEWLQLFKKLFANPEAVGMTLGVGGKVSEQLYSLLNGKQKLKTSCKSRTEITPAIRPEAC
jgi:hypothetical protein